MAKKLVTWLIVLTLLVSIVGSGVMIFLQTSSQTSEENISLTSGENAN